MTKIFCLSLSHSRVLNCTKKWIHCFKSPLYLLSTVWRVFLVKAESRIIYITNRLPIVYFWPNIHSVYVSDCQEIQMGMSVYANIFSSWCSMCDMTILEFMDETKEYPKAPPWSQLCHISAYMTYPLPSLYYYVAHVHLTDECLPYLYM